VYEHVFFGPQNKIFNLGSSEFSKLYKLLSKL